MFMVVSVYGVYGYGYGCVFVFECLWCVFVILRFYLGGVLEERK